MPKIVLTKKQWQKISEILGNLGVLSTGTIILPYLIDKPNSIMVTTGSLLTMLSWLASIIIARKG